MAKITDLPQKVFNMVAQNLSNPDKAQLRLVNRDMKKKVDVFETSKLTTVETLPQNVFNMVAQNLPDREKARLRTTSKAMRKQVDIFNIIKEMATASHQNIGASINAALTLRHPIEALSAVFENPDKLCILEVLYQGVLGDEVKIPDKALKDLLNPSFIEEVMEGNSLGHIAALASLPDFSAEQVMKTASPRAVNMALESHHFPIEALSAVFENLNKLSILEFLYVMPSCIEDVTHRSFRKRQELQDKLKEVSKVPEKTLKDLLEPSFVKDVMETGRSHQIETLMKLPGFPAENMAYVLNHPDGDNIHPVVESPLFSEVLQKRLFALIETPEHPFNQGYKSQMLKVVLFSNPSLCPEIQTRLVKETWLRNAMLGRITSKLPICKEAQMIIATNIVEDPANWHNVRIRLLEYPGLCYEARQILSQTQRRRIGEGSSGAA